MEQTVKIFAKALVFAAFAAVLAGGYHFVQPKFEQMKKLEAQRNEAIRKNDAKQRDIDILKRKQQRLASDPDYVVRILREQKRIKSNEILFVLEKDVAAK